MVRGRIHVLVEPLSTEQLWRRPFGFGNSVGHLILHLTGNLNYYIGTQIAGTGSVCSFGAPRTPTITRAR